MREILFRGKHIHMFSSNKPLDGMWCYGYLVDKNYINDKTDRGDGEYLGEMLVDPETIGQYTGMTDKNGTKIFEGDILEDTLGWVFEVRWDNENGRFLGYQSKPRGDTYICYVGREPKSTIIGNIHDNPELMEVEE